MKTTDIFERFAISPCCHWAYDLETALKNYSALGFRYFEVFSSWACSAVDITRPVEEYRGLLETYGMKASAFQLPPIEEEDEGATLDRAVRGAEFAVGLGAPVVLYRAASREVYIRNAKAFLDGIAHLPVTPVLQNHHGTPISTLEDVMEVTEGIADPRMKHLLEVGHFHSSGVSWRQGYDYLGVERIAHVHIKDQIGKQSVPYGEGEVDLKGLFACLENAGYKGRYVVEMEVRDPQNTLHYLEKAIDYIREAMP